MGLRVPVPDPRRCVASPAAHGWAHISTPTVAPLVHVPPIPGADGFCEFDEMDIMGVSRKAINLVIVITLTDLYQMRASIAEMIHILPPVRLWHF